MERVSLVQGDHHVATRPDVLIGTLLGSCIAICLHDAVAKVGGMNHFLLGEPAGQEQLGAADMQRYGVHAMELLVNEMMRNGASRSRLRAHVYGGANIVRGLGSIGDANAKFARRFIETEGIQLGRFETGGTAARRVEFLPFLGKVRSWVVAESAPVTVTPAPISDSGDLELF